MTRRADGFTLADRLQHPAPLTPVEVATVGVQLAGELDTWHRAGVCHRAIGAEQVEVQADTDGRLRARLRPPTGVAAVAAASQTRYRAPEQLSGRPVGPAADIYSLGVLLLDGLVGPLGGPPVVPDDLGSAWRYLLAGMLAESPADRPTAGTVAHTLGQVPGVSVATAPAPAPGPPAEAAPRSKLLPAGAHVAPVPIEFPKQSRFAKLLPPIPGRRRPQEPDTRQRPDGS